LTPGNHQVTSLPTTDYNGIAWAARDTAHWWEPGVFWPAPVTDYGPDALEAAFLAIGFEPCPDGAAEPGWEKIALYAAGPFYTHAARQLPSGAWTSKLGRSDDIEHDTAEAIAGGVYGEVFRFLKRPALAA
ncbi:MAG TPA: hypothetical protein VH092_30960, partial [Urbifossiella sp.]|nr:hypothetical protein [Urbifossiella sp.]